MVFSVCLLFAVFTCMFLLNVKIENKKVLMIAIWLIMALVVAFRPEDMPDRYDYIMFYKKGGERFEWGYSVLTDFLRMLNFNVYFYLFFFASISIGLKLYAIVKMTPLIWGSLMVYVSHIFILNDAIQMRAAIAAGFLLFSIYYSYKRELIRFLLVTILAFCFHYSSIIIVFVWFLNGKRSYRYLYIGLLLASYAIVNTITLSNYIELIPFLFVQNAWSMYNAELGGEYADIFSLGAFLRLFMSLFSFIFIDKISKKNELFILLAKVYAISIVIFVLFSDFKVVSLRLSLLLQVVEVLLIPMFIYSVNINGFCKRLLVIIIGAILLSANISYIDP
jgi:hypothetical protein